MVYKIVFTVDLATCKALNSFADSATDSPLYDRLFYYLFARFEGVADDPRLWVEHALMWHALSRGTYIDTSVLVLRERIKCVSWSLNWRWPYILGRRE